MTINKCIRCHKEPVKTPYHDTGRFYYSCQTPECHFTFDDDELAIERWNELNPDTSDYDYWKSMCKEYESQLKQMAVDYEKRITELKRSPEWSRLPEVPEAILNDKNVVAFICHIVEPAGDIECLSYNDDYCLARYDVLTKSFKSNLVALNIIEWAPLYKA